MDSLARLCVGVKVVGGRSLLTFVHKFGDEGLELGYLLLEFLDAAGILGDALAVERGLLGGVIGHVLAVLLGVEALLEHAAAIALDDASRHAHDGAVIGHVLDDNRVTADLDVVADANVAEHLGARAHGDVVAQGGVALASFVAGAAERNALVEHAVVAHDGGFADDDAHGVVDKEVLADLCGGMNLDAGDVAGDLREHAGERSMAVFPEPMLGYVVPLGVKTGVRKKDDQTVLRGGILRLDGLDVLANGIDKAHRPPSLSAMAMRFNKV